MLVMSVLRYLQYSIHNHTNFTRGNCSEGISTHEGNLVLYSTGQPAHHHDWLQSVMINAYDLSECDNVLLVGEGNFSFSEDLVSYHTSKQKKVSNVYSTCFQSEVDSSIPLTRLKYLQTQRVKIILGVDATRISSHPELINIKFDRIIFNFPHVGGKMKIQLNRNLLREFFVSAAEVLSESGNVVVALCRGQGGTDADGDDKRSWADCWQIVEMAAFGNFLLKSTFPFPLELFPNYTCTGFRGRNQKFNNQDAVVHIFKLQPPLQCEASEDWLQLRLGSHEICSKPSVKCSFYHYHKFINNPLNRKESIQNFFVRIIQDCTVNVTGVLPSYLDLPMVTDISTDLSVQCCCDGKPSYLRNSLLQVLPSNHLFDNATLALGIVFRKLSGKFSVPPINAQMLVIGPDVRVICERLRETLLEVFQLKLVWKDPNVQELLGMHKFGQFEDIVRIKPFNSNLTAQVDLDRLSLVALGLESWKQVWAPSSTLSTYPPLPFLQSLYPPHFQFDINFSESPSFTNDAFFDLLWQISDDTISGVKLLNSYHPPGKPTCYCYRIVYKSYQYPFYRSRAVSFHTDVVAKCLHMALGVVVN